MVTPIPTVDALEETAIDVMEITEPIAAAGDCTNTIDALTVAINTAMATPTANALGVNLGETIGVQAIALLTAHTPQALLTAQDTIPLAATVVITTQTAPPTVNALEVEYLEAIGVRAAAQEPTIWQHVATLGVLMDPNTIIAATTDAKVLEAQRTASVKTDASEDKHGVMEAPTEPFMRVAVGMGITPVVGGIITTQEDAVQALLLYVALLVAPMQHANELTVS